MLNVIKTLENYQHNLAVYGSSVLIFVMTVAHLIQIAGKWSRMIGLKTFHLLAIILSTLLKVFRAAW